MASVAPMLLVGTLAALGCGSGVVVDAAAGGSPASSASSSGAGGGSSGSGGASPCEGTFLSLDGDGSTQMLNTGCWYEKGQAYNDGPVGYYLAGTPNFAIDACGGPSGSAQELSIGALHVDANQPGMVSSFINYVDATSASWYPMNPYGAVTFTASPSAVGLPVEGTFKGTVAKLGGTSTTLSGTFRACRVSDR